MNFDSLAPPDNKAEQRRSKEMVYELMKQFTGRHVFHEKLCLESKDGVMLMDIETAGDEPGETELYRFHDKAYVANLPEGQVATSVTMISVGYYQDEIPVGGRVVAEYVDKEKKWTKQ